MKNKVFITVIVCALTLIGFLGSYAFFINSVENNKNQEVTVETGTMVLTFSDGNNGFNRELDFGESAEKTFTIENRGTKEGIISVSWMNLLNTYLEGSLTYSFLESDTEDDEYTEIVTNKNVPVSKETKDKGLVSGITIPAKTKKYYKLIITLNNTDFDQTADLQAKLETQFKITEGILDERTDTEKTLAKLNKTVKEGEPNFAEAATTDETRDGLYAMEDDYGTSYYYRGAVEDNYVKFAGFYWRIIRVNGDGSLRILYDGTIAHTNGEASTDRIAIRNIAYNINKNDTKYVGYMYGPEGTALSANKEEAQSNIEDSSIKTAVDNWYKTNILDKGYHEYVSDNIFCNDRTIPGQEVTGWAKDTGLGYGSNLTAYGGYVRFQTNIETSQPQFKCLQDNDKFTVNSDFGNGALTYPVGLPTADEIVAAGGGQTAQARNTSLYLFKGKAYWSMTPYNYDSINGTKRHLLYLISDNTSTNNNQIFTYGSAYITRNVAPVISLKPEYVNTFMGDGTMTNPLREKELEV